MKPKIFIVAFSVVAHSFFSIGADSYDPVHAKEQPEMVVQMGHSGYVAAYDISPDGEYLLTGSIDARMKLWNLSTGKELRTYEGHSRDVSAVSFSPDGHTALSGSLDGTVKLWDVAQGTLIRTLPFAANEINSIDFLPDGKSAFIYCSFPDSPPGLVIFDIESESITKRFDDAWSYKNLSIDGRYALFSYGNDASVGIAVFDLILNRITRTFTHPATPWSACFSPDNRYVAIGYLDNSILVWELETGSILRKFGQDGDGGVFSIAFSSDGKFVMAASNFPDRLSVFDFYQETLVRSSEIDIGYWPGPNGRFSPDGKCLIVGSTSCDSSIYDTATGSLLRRLGGFSPSTESLAFSPDGRLFASGELSNSVGIWNIYTLQLTKHSQLHMKPILFVGFLPDSERILSAEKGAFTLYPDGTSFPQYLWNAATKRTLRVFNDAKDNDRVLSAAMSSDGRYLLTSSSSDSRIKVTAIETGASVASLAGHENSVHAIAISRDGEIAVSGSSDRTVRIWDMRTGRHVKTLISSDWVSSIAISPDGGLVAAGSINGEISIWRVEDGQMLTVLRGHYYIVSGLAFSPDGRRLASSSHDSSVTLWDLESGKAIQTHRKHTSSVNCVAFSPDGRFVVSGSNDGTVRLWNIEGDETITFMSSPDGRQWLVFTDDGYWDSSRDGIDLVAMVRGMESWNIDQFAARNNRPDIILRRLHGSPDLIEFYESQYRRRLDRMGLMESELTRDYRVPTSAIVSSRQEGRIVEIKMAFRANGKPLSRYNVYVNDVPLYDAEGRSLSGEEAIIDASVELNPGDNKIEISCIDLGGAESFRANQLFHWSGAVVPNLYYIGFGVSRYKDAALDLGFAAKDAEDLAGIFTAMEGKAFGKVFTAVLLDEEVTPERIKDAKRLCAGARPEDTLVLFIAGHGFHDLDENRTYYYLTHETSFEDLAGTAADFESIENILQGIAPRNKLFLLDTCESGEAVGIGQGTAAKKARGARARIIGYVADRDFAVGSALRGALTQKDRYIFNDLIRRSGSIVFSSCGGDEASYEFDDLGNGAFTASLKNCFTDSSADADHDGTISVAELRHYVSIKVPHLVQARIGIDVQHPTVDRDNLSARFGFPLIRTDADGNDSSTSLQIAP